MSVLKPIVNPPLYPSSPKDILQLMQDTIFLRSGGTLNDFTPASPLSAITEGELQGILDLLYYANQVPDAIALSFLKIAGVMRRAGDFAKVTLTFTLNQPFTTTFQISKDNLVASDESGRYAFFLDDTLYIPAGQLQGQMTATAIEPGNEYNLPFNSITRFFPALYGLQSVNNLEPSKGGDSSENDDDLRNRGYRSLRLTNILSSEADYEAATQIILGEGSVVKVIGRLTSDKISYSNGHVHVFCLSSDRTAPDLAQCQSVRQQLAAPDRCYAGAQVHVSPLEPYGIELHAIVNVANGTNSTAVASLIYQKLQDYLRPGNLTPGATVLHERLQFTVGLCGVDSVQAVSVLVSQSTISANNVPLPFPYSVGFLLGLVVDVIIPADNLSSRFIYGDGGDLISSFLTIS